MRERQWKARAAAQSCPKTRFLPRVGLKASPFLSKMTPFTTIGHTGDLVFVGTLPTAEHRVLVKSELDEENM